MQRNLRLAVGAAAILLALPGVTLAKHSAKHGGSSKHAAAGVSADRLGGKPNINGIWQAMSGADWDLEPHSAQTAPAGEDKLGALGAIPASTGVVQGGAIPYLPAGAEQRDKNRKAAPMADPEAACYLPGIPRATYVPHAFQIIQSPGDDILFAYEYDSANRVIHMQKAEEPPIDTWMGTSYGTWTGDTLTVTTLGQNGRTWLDRAGNYLTPKAKVTEKFTPKDRDHIAYEATIEDPSVYSKPWTISMTLYRKVEPRAQLLEFNCVPFSDLLIYGDLKPKDAKP
jgi:hypothetical protein